MELLDKIKRHLPTYLNPESRKKLFDELKAFPSNIDERMYSSDIDINDDIIYQGDIIDNQPIIFLPDTSIKEKRVFVISNTCDNDINNPRPTSPTVSYCPIIDFTAYINMINKTGFFKTKEALEGHIKAIKDQRITTMFYLPSHKDISESIVLLSSFNSLRLDNHQKNNFIANRKLCLANYGFYLFLIKLSIHLTRIEENVDRG